MSKARGKSRTDHARNSPPRRPRLVGPVVQVSVFQHIQIHMEAFVLEHTEKADARTKAGCD